jgi:hypothetical protein
MVSLLDNLGYSKPYKGNPNHLGTVSMAQVSPSVETFVSMKRLKKEACSLYDCYSIGAINCCRFNEIFTSNKQSLAVVKLHEIAT